MKNILLLLLIVLILGSLKKDNTPCRSYLFMQYYKNGKKVFVAVRQDGVYFSNMEQAVYDVRTGKRVICDSIAIKIIR